MKTMTKKKVMNKFRSGRNAQRQPESDCREVLVRNSGSIAPVSWGSGLAD